MTKLKSIPCNIITGFLGVGKTTTILNLLKQKPANEKWAVLVNEFGEIGLDGALIDAENKQQDVFIREIPGGCMCCASGVPMQIALNMLLIKAKPDRLLIEPTGLGHPKEVHKILSSEHYKETLSLQACICLVDARHFNSKKHLDNNIFQQQLEVADLLVINKSDLASSNDLQAFEHYLDNTEALSGKPFMRIQNGQLNAINLQSPSLYQTQPVITKHHSHHSHHSHSAGDKGSVVEEEALPQSGFLMKVHQEEGFTSMGWRIHSQSSFDMQRLTSWLKTLPTLRIKGIVRANEGYALLNMASDAHATGNELAPQPPLNSQHVNELQESRIELIFEQNNINPELLNEALHSCLVKNL